MKGYRIYRFDSGYPQFEIAPRIGYAHLTDATNAMQELQAQYPNVDYKIIEVFA